MRRYWLVGFATLAVVVLTALSTVIVDETEHAIVTRFGRVTAIHSTPGLYWKLPSPIDRVTRLDKRVLFTRVPEAEFLTSDKKNVMAAMYVTWRIRDPVTYLASVRTRDAAEARLVSLIQSGLGSALGERPFTDFVPTEQQIAGAAPKGDRIAPLEAAVMQRSAPTALTDLGIEIEAMGATRFNFPDQNLSAVFARMRAERERIANGYRSEGEAEAKKITAEGARESAELVTNAEADAQRTRGEADAEAARIYANAYRGKEGFYDFLRTLESYGQIFSENTTLVLPADAPFLKELFKGPQGAEALPHGRD